MIDMSLGGERLYCVTFEGHSFLMVSYFVGPIVESFQALCDSIMPRAAMSAVARHREVAEREGVWVHVTQKSKLDELERILCDVGYRKVEIDKASYFEQWNVLSEAKDEPPEGRSVEDVVLSFNQEVTKQQEARRSKA